MPLPPGLPPNLPRIGYGMPQVPGALVPQMNTPPPGGIPFDPSSLPAYGQGPSPSGVPIGTDDHSQMNGGPSGVNGVAGDAQEESDFTFPDAIDSKRITLVRDKEQMRQLENDIHDLIESGRNARISGRRDYWVNSWRKTFEGKDPGKGGPWDGSSRITPPDMRAAIESINSRNMEATFASRERIRFKPRKAEDSEAAKALVRHIDEFFHAPEIDLRGRLTSAALTGLVDGTVLCDTFWRREKRKRRRRVRITNDILAEFAGPGTTPGPILNPAQFPHVRVKGKSYRYGQIATIEEEVIVRNHFDFRFIPVTNFFMYPCTAATVEEATIAGYDFWQTENDMRVAAREGSYDEKAVKRLFDDPDGMRPIPESQDPTTANNNGGLVGLKLDGLDEGNEGDVKGFARYRMRKFWARVRDIDGDGVFEDMLGIMCVSTHTIVMLQAEPYDNLKRSIGYIDFDPRVGGGFYGYSLVEKCLDSHLELEAVVRLGIDLAVLASTTIVPIEPVARRSAQDIVFRPGPQFWKEDTQGTIKAPITFPMVQNSYIPERSLLSSYIEKVTGASEILTGATPGDGTATAANIQVSSAGVRSKPMLLNIMKFLTWLYNQYWELTTQFIEETPGNSFAISLGPGKGFEQIDLATLSLEGNLTAYCDAIDPDVALRLQAAEKKLTLLMQSPFVQADVSRMWQCIFEYIYETDRSFNPEPVMGTLAEAKDQQAAATKAQQAQQQAAQSEPKVPQIPPGISAEWLAVYVAQNPLIGQGIINALSQIEIAEGAGEIQQTTTKIAGDAIRDGLKPEPKVPNGTNGSTSRRPAKAGGR